MRNCDRLHTVMEVLEVLKIFSQKMIDSGYDGSSRQEVLKSGLRKYFRELAKATAEGHSIYRSRQEMDRKKEVKDLVSRPWFRRMRGGAQLRMVKEGEDKEVARARISQDKERGGEDGKRDTAPKPRMVKEVECVVFVTAAAVKPCCAEMDGMRASSSCR